MTATAVRRLLASVTIALGAFVATLALTTMVSRHLIFVPDSNRFDVFFSGARSASALGAIVAVVVATTVRSPRNVFVALGFGITLLPITVLLETSSQLHQRGLAGGLMLGGCAALTGTRDRRILQCALAVGVVSAFTAAGPLEFSRIPERYADYLEPSPQIYLLVFLGVFAALLVLSGALSMFDAPLVESQGTSRVLLIGITVPVAWLVLYWLSVRAVGSVGSGGAIQDRWLLGLAIIPLLVGAAFALPGVSGSVVLAALAYLATSSTTAFGASAAVASIAALLAGAAVGWRRLSPLTGMGILALVAVAGIFSGYPLDVIDGVANILLLPFATGLIFASLVPTTSPALTISVTTPIVISIPIGGDFGWTAYTPLTPIERTFWPNTWQWASSGVAVLSVLVAGAALVLLQRLRGRESAAA
ncbi:hypothetical protein QMK17_24005 [Rhodococcus sp. G-MC3]|uniref:hypothetical protein n=1 Tax=Rhodococcus sp. G-MC3 TaxID=3046209 RepID=UPI0024BA729C|nr:hypothetical protein [Rhodococcus sp. G-MC3]MDJ0396374.1 hypothetical protein [Rhodococcus sp. G-MC3]